MVEITENQNAQTELVAFSNNDAKYIRRQIQLENEELYFLYIYIVIYDKNII